MDQKGDGLIPELGYGSHATAIASEPQCCHLKKGLMARGVDQGPGVCRQPAGSPESRAPPGGDMASSPPCRISSVPEGAQHLTN